MKDKIFSFFKTNKNIWIITAIVIALLILTIILASNKSKIGNTSGNLTNLGFTVEEDGWVYYLGIKNDNSDGIYKMKENGKKKQKISDNSGMYLNKSSNFIYYLDTENYDIKRMKINGKDIETVVKDVDMDKITVIDNWIYYYKDSKFYREKTNGEDKQILSNKSIINYQIDEKWIYYSYVENKKYIIAKMKTNGENNEIIGDDLSKTFFVIKDKIYYVYENYDENEMEYNYEFYTIKSNGKDKKMIVNLGKDIDPDSINIDKNRIFYVKENDEGIKSIYSIGFNGKDERKIVDLNGTTTLININNGWIYYTDSNENMDSQMYRIRFDGKNKQDI